MYKYFFMVISATLMTSCCLQEKSEEAVIIKVDTKSQQKNRNISINCEIDNGKFHTQCH